MSNPWILRRVEPDARKLSLLCLPHAGGGSAAYLSWADALGDGVDICPVQLPGRETRLADAPVDDMTLLVSQLTEALAPWAGRRYALYGHSMGAHLAFELARSFRQSGLALPQCLIVSGARAPHLPLGTPPLADLPEAELLRSLGQRYGNHVDAQMMELMRLMLPTLRADLRLVEQHVHVPQPPLSVPIHALAGSDDASVALADARQWGRHTDLAFEFKTFAGAHFFTATSRAPFLACLARALQQPVQAAAA